jgi:peptidoglycan/LPS O-acetylase OafA/YrhL
MSKLLSVGPFVMLGEISFALYIVHMGVLQWYVQHQSILLTTSQSFRAGLYWALCILLAYLMHKGIEEPMRQLLLRGSASRITFRAALSSQASYANILLVLVLALLKSVSPM